MDDEYSDAVLRLLDRPVLFHRVFVDLTGSVTAAVLLSQALYWQNRARNSGGRWWYKTHEDWERELGMTRHELDSARKKCSPFLEQKREGLPCRLYYRVNIPEIIKACKQVRRNVANEFAGIRQTGLPESGNSLNTESSYESSTEMRVLSKDSSDFALRSQSGGRSSSVDLVADIADEALLDCGSHGGGGSDVSAKKTRRAAMSPEQWKAFSFETNRVFPGWKSSAKSVQNGIRAFVREHGLERLPELYREVQSSDFLMARGGHSGISGKPVTPTWIFAKNFKTGEYRFNKILEGDYTNDRMAFIIERVEAPISFPADDFMQVETTGGGRRRVRKAQVCASGRKRYLLLAHTADDGTPMVDDQGEGWSEEAWMSERERYYARYPEEIPDDWEKTVKEFRGGLPKDAPSE